MKVFIAPIKVFPDKKNYNFSLIPCLKKVIIPELDKDNVNPGGAATGVEQKTEITYEFEIYCPVDQRIIIDKKITDLVAFLSPKSLSSYQSLPSAVSNVNIEKSNLYNDVVYDILNIKEKQTSGIFKDLTFFGRFNAYQNFNAIPVKPENLLKLSDTAAFGYTTKFKIEKNSSQKLRKIKNAETEVKILKSKIKAIEVKKLQNSYFSEKNHEKHQKVFKREYFKLIKQGVDPLHYFEHADKKQSLGQLLKGIKNINTNKNNDSVLRKSFKNIIINKIEAGKQSNQINVKKLKISNRIAKLKCKIRKSRESLEKLSRENSHIIIFAYNKDGIKIDAYSYPINFESILNIKSKNIYQNPILKYSAASSRNLRGHVISNLKLLDKNNERRTLVNVYTRKVNNLFPYATSGFKKTNTTTVSNLQGIKLVDGTTSKSDFSGALSLTKPVFHRYNTFDYMFNIPVGNTISSFVGPKNANNNIPYCSFYVINDIKKSEVPSRAKIIFNKISENVKKIRIMKRKVILGSLRGLSSEFKPIKGINFKNTLDVFLSSNLNTPNAGPVYDYDLENNQLYEYKLRLFTESGSYFDHGKTFLYKHYEPSDVIGLKIKSIGDDNVNYDTIGSKELVKNVFSIQIIKKSTDVDKVLNSVFGDTFELFKDAFKQVSSTTNLIYGVKVSKINTDNGQVEDVGEFTARPPNTSNNQNNTNVLSTLVYDKVSVLSNFIYEFHPYVALPEQIMSSALQVVQNLGRLSSINNRIQSNMSRFSANRARLTTRLQSPSGRPRALVSIQNSLANNDSSSGAISSNQTLLDHNNNKVFDNGLTGDISYVEIKSIFDLLTQEYASNAGIRGRVKKVNYFASSEEKSVNKIQKSFYNVRIDIESFDYLVDFYVILKRENHMTTTIEGCIHSEDSEEKYKSYQFLSECEGSFGLIEYYVVSVFKTGKISSPIYIGNYIERY
jgi:hypothetical protein